MDVSLAIGRGYTTCVSGSAGSGSDAVGRLALDSVGLVLEVIDARVAVLDGALDFLDQIGLVGETCGLSAGWAGSQAG